MEGDNKVKNFFLVLADIIYANLLWLFFSFAGILITTGASTKALFASMFQILKKDEPNMVFRTFWEAFKEGFATSTVVWLAIVGLGIGLFYCYNYALENGIDILFVFVIVGLYQLLIFAIYFFPIFAVFETKNTGVLLKNVILISNKNLWINIKVLGSFALIILLVMFVHSMFILIAIGLYGLLVSLHLKKLFLKFEEQVIIKNNDINTKLETTIEE